MNIAKINEIRASIGLPAVTVKLRANNQAKNQARRAQENRDLKAKRAQRSK